MYIDLSNIQTTMMPTNIDFQKVEQELRQELKIATGILDVSHAQLHCSPELSTLLGLVTATLDLQQLYRLLSSKEASVLKTALEATLKEGRGLTLQLHFNRINLPQLTLKLWAKKQSNHQIALAFLELEPAEKEGEFKQKNKQPYEGKKLETQLLETMSEGVVIYNEELYPVIANQQAWEILQLTEDQFYGRSLYDEDLKIVDAFEEPMVVEEFPVYQTFTKGKEIRGFLMGVCVNANAYTWISVNTNLVELDKNGQTQKYVVVSYADISSLISYRKMERWYSTAIGSMAEGLVVHDRNGVIVNFNAAALNLLGLTEDQLYGKTAMDPQWKCFKIDGSPFPGEEHPAIQSLKTGKSLKAVLMEVWRVDGSKVFLSINSSPIFFSADSTTPDAAVATFTDVTEQRKNEIILSKTKQMLLETSLLSLVGGWEFDLETETLSWSEVTKLIHGVPQDYEPTLTSAIHFYEADSQTMIQLALEQLAVSGESFDQELEIINAQGQRLWVRVIGKADLKNGRPTRLYGTFQDISKQKALEQQLEKANEAEFAKLYQRQKRITQKLKETHQDLHNFFQLSSDMIVIANADFIPIRINPAYLEVLGCTKQEALSQPVWNWMQQNNKRTYLDQFKAAIQQQGIFSYVALFQTKGGLEKWLSWNVAMDSKTNMLYAIGRDISAIKELELKLRKAKEIAVHNAKVKEEFLANMSHEIRTPMNAILGFSDILLKDVKEPELLNYTRAIHNSAENLLVVINDILDLSKIEAGKMVLEEQPFELNKMIETVVTTLRPEMERKHLWYKQSISADIHPRISGAPKRITQVLLNLLGNAIKFTIKGGIELRVDLNTQDGNDFLQFDVMDTGIGIPDSKFQQIFDSFTQLSQTAIQTAKGTGLGLAICKRLVNLMGGAIYVFSTLDQGSCFSFTIPYRPVLKESEITEQSEQEKGAMPKTCHILIVEDYLLNQKLAAKFIQRLGYTYQIAENGAIALDLLKSERFDLILMDIRMPVLDGIETTKRLRNIGYTTPVIALTANALEKEKAHCLAIGMNDYLTKPFKVEELQKMIIKYCSSL